MLRQLMSRCMMAGLCLPLLGVARPLAAQADPWDRGGGHWSGGGDFGGGRRGGGERYGGSDRWGGGARYGDSGRWAPVPQVPLGRGGYPVWIAPPRSPYEAYPQAGRGVYGAPYGRAYVPPVVGGGSYVDRWRQGGPWSPYARTPGRYGEDPDPRKPKPHPGPRGEGDGDYR